MPKKKLSEIDIELYLNEIISQLRHTQTIQDAAQNYSLLALKVILFISGIGTLILPILSLIFTSIRKDFTTAYTDLSILFSIAFFISAIGAVLFYLAVTTLRRAREDRIELSRLEFQLSFAKLPPTKEQLEHIKQLKSTLITLDKKINCRFHTALLSIITSYFLIVSGSIWVITTLN